MTKYRYLTFAFEAHLGSLLILKDGLEPLKKAAQAGEISETELRHLERLFFDAFGCLDRFGKALGDIVK